VADALITRVADAVRDSLNGATLEHRFAATREWVTDWDRASGGLRVVVVPVSEVITIEARQDVTGNTYTMDLGVQDECLPSDTEKIDSIFSLMDAMIDHLRNNTLIAGLTLVAISRDPIFDQEHLLSANQIRLTASLAYRGLRSP